jgi:hypothetical protein
MRHHLYPSQVAVYATEENIKYYKLAYPHYPIHILHPEEKMTEEEISQFIYAPDPFDRFRAKELGISQQDLATAVANANQAAQETSAAPTTL